jgi:hypothetical protein
VVGRAGFEPATNGLKVPGSAAIGLTILGAAESIAVGTSLPRLSHCRMSRFYSVRPELDGDVCRLTVMYLAPTRERPDAVFDAPEGVRLADGRRRGVDDLFAGNLHTLHARFGRGTKSVSLNRSAIYSASNRCRSMRIKASSHPVTACSTRTSASFFCCWLESFMRDRSWLHSANSSFSLASIRSCSDAGGNAIGYKDSFSPEKCLIVAPVKNFSR